MGVRTERLIAEHLKAYMMSVLSILCFIVAITSIQKCSDLLPVALALILGGILGGAADLSGKISQLAWDLTGKFSILMVKALMDFPVAYLYGGRLGPCICLLAVPEMAFLCLLFLISSPLQQLLTAEISGNLYACGGAVILSSAFSMAGIRNFQSPNLMPAMVLVIPFSLLLGA